MRTFVGFGLGPIQAGLFLAEAHRSGRYSRLVVAETAPDVLGPVRRAEAVGVNVAHADRVQALTIAPVEVFDPTMPADRAALVDAVAGADEMATALPSVAAYAGGGRAGVAALLAEGLGRKVAGRGPLAVVYAAENQIGAAGLLAAAVLEHVPEAGRAPVRRRVQFLDTVIGKMSGRAAAGGDLVPIAPGAQHAFLVESFNRILTGQVRRPDDAGGGRDLDPDWAGFQSGIPVFDPKPDLVPFAEAKLYGHNAGHALAAYLARLLGFTWMHQLRERADLLTVVVEAMAKESGAPLARRYAGVDPLFAPEGFRAHASDLVGRMVNPFVRDTVARVGRDPARKLGWNDRLIGAMRLALEAGIEPRRYAWGAAAALDALGVRAEEAPGRLLDIWRPAAPLPEHSRALLAHIGTACDRMHAWKARGCPVLDVE